MKKTNPINNVGADDSVCPRNKGITLIALIITIIVLLILTIVSIRLIVNEGFISKSEKAVTEYELAQEEENVKLAVNYAKIKVMGGALTGGDLTEGLNNQNLEPDRDLAETAPFTFKIKDGTGKEYIIMDDGKIGTSQAKAEDWVYTVTGTEARITGCNLTGESLKNVIVPKYLTEEDGTILTVTKLGDGSKQIANFSGTLVAPNDVVIEKYAFNNCPDIEKVVIGENTTTAGYNGSYQFTSVNTKLKEVKIGKGSKIVYLTFRDCSNIEKVTLCDNVYIYNTAFYKCYVSKIEIGNNVTVQGRAFLQCTNEIEQILIGDNFTSEGNWLEGCTIKDVEIGSNASLGTNGLMAQSGVTIKGTVTINGPVKELGEHSLIGCTIKAQNDCLEIARDGIVEYQSMNYIKGINSLKLGTNVNIGNGSGGLCIRAMNDMVIVCEGAIIVNGTAFGSNVILPEKLEFSSESVINQTFYWLTSGYNATLKEIILNPGVTVSSLNSYPKNLKITLKNISEWDSELLESNKTVIQNFGLTNYEEIDGNGVFTK